MSTEIKKSAAPVEKPVREPLPVRTMWFIKPTNLPGKNSADALMCKDDAPGARWSAAFLPWLRLFEICYYEPGSTVAKRRNIGEHMISGWEPA